jgi:hypothetical protein
MIIKNNLNKFREVEKQQRQGEQVQTQNLFL